MRKLNHYSCHFFAVLSVYTVFLMPFTQTLAQQQSGKPKIHLITLSDSGDKDFSSFLNADIAKMANLFLSNVPPDQLTIAHIVVQPTRNADMNLDNPKIFEQGRLSDFGSERCPQGCQSWARYVGDMYLRQDVSHHIAEQIRFVPIERRPVVRDITTDVTNAISRLSINRGVDTVVFYYTGHGEYNSRIQSLNYTFNDNRFCTMRSVSNSIRQKGPRLTVFLNDCCNLTEKHRKPGAKEVPQVACMRPPCPSPKNISAPFEALFVKPSGTVNFYAAEVGKPAIAYAVFHNISENDDRVYAYKGKIYAGEETTKLSREQIKGTKEMGGIFTEAIYRSLSPTDDGIEPNIHGWDAFKQQVSDKTNKMFRDYFNGEVTVDTGSSRFVLLEHTPYLDKRLLRD